MFTKMSELGKDNIGRVREVVSERERESVCVCDREREREIDR